MDKKTFKIGFLIGALVTIGIGVYVLFNMKSIMSYIAIKPIVLAQLDLENANGEKVQFEKGKPIVINFWATWCAPCVEEFPEFEELNKKYSDKVNFLMVSDEATTRIEKFKSRKGYTLNMVRSLKPFDDYGLTLRPATYFYDSEGKLITKIAGGISKEELEEGIKALIGN